MRTICYYQPFFYYLYAQERKKNLCCFSLFFSSNVIHDVWVTYWVALKILFLSLFLYRSFSDFFFSSSSSSSQLSFIFHLYFILWHSNIFSSLFSCYEMQLDVLKGFYQYPVDSNSNYVICNYQMNKKIIYFRYNHLCNLLT